MRESSRREINFSVLQLELLFINQVIRTEVKSSPYGKYFEYTQLLTSQNSKWYNYHVDVKRLLH